MESEEWRRTRCGAGRGEVGGGTENQQVKLSSTHRQQKRKRTGSGVRIQNLKSRPSAMHPPVRLDS